MQYSFSKSFDISYSKSDRYMCLSIPDAVSVVQELNTDYFKSIGSDNVTVNTNDNALWVITKTRLHFEVFPTWGQTVVGNTNTCRTSGFQTHLYSDFTIADQHAFSAKQELCVIDTQKRDLRRIDTISYPKDMEEVKEASPIAFYRLRETFTEQDLAYTDHFRYCDIDYSHHVNNVAYVHHLINAMDQDFFDTHKVTDFEIHYHHECLEGQTFSVYRKDIGGAVDLQMVCNGETAVDARIAYES